MGTQEHNHRSQQGPVCRQGCLCGGDEPDSPWWVQESGRVIPVYLRRLKLGETDRVRVPHVVASYLIHLTEEVPCPASMDPLISMDNRLPHLTHRLLHLLPSVEESDPDGERRGYFLPGFVKARSQTRCGVYESGPCQDIYLWINRSTLVERN